MSYFAAGFVTALVLVGMFVWIFGGRELADEGHVVILRPGNPGYPKEHRTDGSETGMKGPRAA